MTPIVGLERDDCDHEHGGDRYHGHDRSHHDHRCDDHDGDRHHGRGRVRRIVAFWPETGRTEVVGSFAGTAGTDRFALAVDPNLGLYLASSDSAGHTHRVVLLNVALGSPEVVGVADGHGVVAAAMARADATQVGVLVDTGDTQRVVTYPLSGFQPADWRSPRRRRLDLRYVMSTVL